jgi:hypothetical protein
VSPTAVLLTLLLNGQPLPTQPPAFVSDGTVMVGFRDLAQALGATVVYDPATLSVTARRGHRVIQLSVGGAEAFVDAKLVKLPAASAMLDGNLAVPVRFLAEGLGASVQYDTQARTVNVITPPEEPPVPVQIGEIVRAPESFADRTVIVKGEYRGWRASAFAAATRGGPPVSRSDWVLQDDTDQIYCTAERAVETPFELLPTQSVGRRVIVRGRVAVSTAAQPYLIVESIVAVAGLGGLVCSLRTDREYYAPGDAVRLTLRVANPFTETVSLDSAGLRVVEFTVEREGQPVKRWTILGPGSEADLALAANESKEIEAVWDQTDEQGRPAPWGIYRVTATAGQRLKSCPCAFRIGG